MRKIITLLFCLFAISAMAQTDTEEISAEQTTEKTATEKTAKKFERDIGIVRPFQASFVAPLGSNWLDSHLITNKASFNVLGGHSYGNLYFEFGSLYNINLYLTRGFQMAGVFNWSGGTDNAVQFAGVFNTSTDGNAAVQFGGVVNIASESTAQFAGAGNVTAGSTGTQMGGVFNFASESTAQFAGAGNVTAGPAGTQMSGVFNFAQGAAFQSASVLNISDGSTGTQMSPVLNIAKEVNGLQLGLINISGTMNGVPVGLFNVVKNNGKFDFEIGFSESLNTFMSFKMGVQKFYTIFSGAINYLDNPTLYMAGVGFGTYVDLMTGSGWGYSIELMCYDIIKEKKYSDDLNMLTQFKIIISKQFGDYFKVFAGPVGNFTISRYENPSTGKIGTTLSPPWSSIWKKEKEKDKITLDSWIGFEAGVGISI